MAGVVYSQDVYNLVVETKEYNETYINELYAAMPSFTFMEKFKALQTIDALKTCNLEYEKYILTYQDQINVVKKKNEYVVLEGDTLQRIAYKTTGDIANWEKIYRLNNLQDILLSPGDILLVPEV
jgi:nucleoid-associated protein YgaU